MRSARTWWGKRFIEALEGFTDSGRLQRGRGYRSGDRILAFDIGDGGVSATVRGNINPYFGVYKEPHYKVRIRLKPIPAGQRARVAKTLGSDAAMVSQLLMNQMPDDIDSALADIEQPLLPRNRRDFVQTDCDCPDHANPCKHIAGVYYRLAERLDQDPFLLFELRDLPRDALRQALGATPLGRALTELAREQDPDRASQPRVSESFFTRPTPADAVPDYQTFWHGAGRLPSEQEPAQGAALPAILVRKGGDYPPFWDQDRSFIDVMEELYSRVRGKNKGVF